MTKPGDDWTDENEGPHEVKATEPISPEDWARVIVKRPGMYLGRASFDRAVGFVHGLEHPLIVKCRTQEDISALPTSRHHDLLERNDDLNEPDAIHSLEPLLVELFTALQNER